MNCNVCICILIAEIARDGLIIRSYIFILMAEIARDGLVAGFKIEVKRYITFVHIHNMLHFQIELSTL